MTLKKLIIGAHAIIDSSKPAADRAFLRDIFGLPHVDAGQAWLIFGLRPAELAIHPSSKNNVHELYFMCTGIDALVFSVTGKGISYRPVESTGWGELTQITLPGGGKLGVYQPRHVRSRPRRSGTVPGPRTAHHPTRNPISSWNPLGPVAGHLRGLATLRCLLRARFTPPSAPRYS